MTIESSTELNETQKILQTLSGKGLSPDDIAMKTGDRVSPRTIYRWMQGKSKPQQQRNFEMLQILLDAIEADPDFLGSNQIINLPPRQ